MTAKYFVDTNIILYAAGHDPAESDKRSRALAVLEEPALGLSGQVLQEFVANALNKKRHNITEPKIHVVLRVLDEYPCMPVTSDLVREALLLRTRHQISYWDATILAAAQALGCHTLYSEDLNHGQLYDRVKVINPFVATFRPETFPFSPFRAL